MKVLLCIRNDYSRNFGGDCTQLLMTAKYLRKKGNEVDINNGCITDYSNYDIVHLFNLTTIWDTYKYFKIAHSYKKNIVLTPLYWNLKQYYNFIKDIDAAKLWDKCRAYTKEILAGCKMIYPNSYMEKHQITNEFGHSIPCKVIYNGVDILNDETPLYNFKDRYNLDDYILCVGRIMPLKNQLTLAKVCSDLNHKLILIGNVSNKMYFHQCLEYNNVMYLGFLDNYNIYNAYRFARAHVMPSYVEISGISSLEAGATGCNIVSTDNGSAREYFNNLAYYFSPFEENSLYDVIESAYKKPKDNKLKDYIINKYSWKAYADELNDSYMELMKCK